jgi:hypothetical protein
MSSFHNNIYFLSAFSSFLNNDYGNNINEAKIGFVDLITANLSELRNFLSED